MPLPLLGSVAAGHRTIRFLFFLLPDATLSHMVKECRKLFSAFYQVRRSRHLVLEPPIIWIYTIFWLLWQLFDNFLTTFWQFWQLFEHFLTTFWQLFDNFLTIFWQLFDNFLTTFWQLLSTFWQLFDWFLTTFDNICYLFFHFCGGSQLWKQILWIKFHICCVYFIPNCTWFPNYSVLVYIVKTWPKVTIDKNVSIFLTELFVRVG
jgi:hypothetical protein